MKFITIGSRGSSLALRQSEIVMKKIRSKFPHVGLAVKIIKTTGDRFSGRPLNQMDDKGVFTKEIDDSLLKREIDLAVHSLKDIPTEIPDGLVIKAVSRREYSGDALVSKRNSKLKDLPKGSTIATGSLRRKAQLLNYRSDFQIVPIRGNLETRLNKFDSSDYDGMIMAYVGLNRLGYEERVAEVLPPEIMLPSAGQGVIAVVIREGDSEMSVLLEHLEDKPTRIAVTAEREFLNFLGGGCHIPVGVLGTVQNKRLILKGMISDLNGEKMVSGEVEGDWSESSALGRELAGKLLDAGGQEILESVKRRY